jgi:hypothetical protein
MHVFFLFPPMVYASGLSLDIRKLLHVGGSTGRFESFPIA